MGDKITLKESFLRSIKFDEEFLKKLDDFLKKNFQKVLYGVKTDKHSLREKVELDSFLSYLKSIKNEKIQEIQISAYEDDKKVGFWGEKLNIDFFGERKLLPNVTYEYKDGLTNTDRGFLEQLNQTLKENRFWYANLFDSGVIPSEVKYIFTFLMQIVLSVVFTLVVWQIKDPVRGWLAATGALCLVVLIFNYLFPRLVFILTEKEQNQHKKYNSIKKFLRWIIGGVFFIILGIVIQKYFLT